MTLLTDSEQKKLLEELCNTTRTKVETVLKRYKLDRIPDEIQELRRANDKQHKKGRGLWQAVWHGLGVFKAEGDKLFKE